jgi:NAD(P)-dependent dehydrogenase (short-subunit alcohol dehydrogenase family)
MSARRPASFVTGASQGIGATIAEALARRGFDVAVSSTRAAKLSTVVSKVTQSGGRAVPIELDVRSPSSIVAAMKQAVSAFGELDVLVNNAGVPLKKPAVDITPGEWGEVIDTNLTGAFFMSQEMARHLLAAGRPGCIINIASTHGLVGLPERAAYSIAKGAMVHMARVLAVEWAANGIRVNAVVPGRVDTPSRAASLAEPGYRDMALNRVPLRRFATSDEVAAAVCYLASPEAAYVTGQALVLDGGLTAQ